MTTAITLTVLALLAALWLQIKGWFLGRKAEQQKNKVTETKNEAQKKVAAAASADDEFQRRLREYRDKK